MSTEFKEETKTDIDTAEVEYYDLVFYNDETTPFNFVMIMLTDIVNKSLSEAEEITLKIHESKAAAVHTSTQSIVDEMNRKIQAIVKEEGLSFKTAVEKQ